MRAPPCIAPLCALLAAGLPAAAYGEGSLELGNQPVAADTVLYVDIFDTRRETIAWQGYGSIMVTDPAGYQVGSFASGDVIDLSEGDAGVWKIELVYPQTEAWDVAVLDPTEPGGRLFSTLWDLDTDTYTEEGAFNGSFYALVPGGVSDFDGVIEIKFDGLSGRKWQMSANPQGVDGPDAGRSVSMLNHGYQPLYPIYLNPPAKAAYDVQDPSPTGALGFHAEEGICGGLASGYSTGVFTFEADLTATYHIVCDLNGDGVFDLTSNDDLALTGTTSVGTNEVSWDGLDNGGEPIPAGSYDCQVTVTVGEVHFVASDVETSYPGMRMYEMASQGSRLALPMIWNDHLVQRQDEPMPNGEESLVSPGPEGLDPGNYDAEAVPNVNARAWGAFTEEGKGNYTYLDTFVWLRSATSDTVRIEVLDGVTDDNHDGKPDTCWEAWLHGGCSSAGRRPVGWVGLLLAGLLGLVLRRSQES
jgi:hypothetical protein